MTKENIILLQREAKNTKKKNRKSIIIVIDSIFIAYTFTLLKTFNQSVFVHLTGNGSKNDTKARGSGNGH